jgi:hypothetical protein
MLKCIFTNCHFGFKHLTFLGRLVHLSLVNNLIFPAAAAAARPVTVMVCFVNQLARLARTCSLA